MQFTTLKKALFFFFKVMLALPQWVLLRGGLLLLMVVQELPFISWYLLSLISLGGEGRYMLLS